MAFMLLAKTRMTTKINLHHVWKSKDTKKLKWTSLLGGKNCLLLRKLPDHFEKFLPPHHAETVHDTIM